MVGPVGPQINPLLTLIFRVPDCFKEYGEIKKLTSPPHWSPDPQSENNYGEMGHMNIPGIYMPTFSSTGKPEH